MRTIHHTTHKIMDGNRNCYWVDTMIRKDCLTTNDRPGCNPQGGRVLGAQKDFQDQKGRLQEEV